MVLERPAPLALDSDMRQSRMLICRQYRGRLEMDSRSYRRKDKDGRDDNVSDPVLNRPRDVHRNRSRSRDQPLLLPSRDLIRYVLAPQYEIKLQLFIEPALKNDDGSFTFINQSGIPQYHVAVVNRDEISIDPLTLAAANVIDKLVHVAINGTAGCSRIQDLYQVIQYVGKRDRRAGNPGNGSRNEDRELRELRTDNAEYLDDINTMQAELDDTHEKVAARDRKITRMKREFDDLKAKYAEAEDEHLYELGQSLTDKHALNDRVKELASNNADYIKEIAALKAHVKELELKLSAAAPPGVDGDAAVAAPSPVKQELNAESVDAPSGQPPHATQIDVSWKLPDCHVAKTFKNKCQGYLPDFLIAHSTCAVGWQMADCRACGMDSDLPGFVPASLSCACGTMITDAGHHDSLAHFTWVANISDDAKVKSRFMELEAIGFLKREGIEFMTTRVRELLYWEIRTACMRTHRTHKNAVESAIEYLKNIMNANNIAIAAEIKSHRIVQVASRMYGNTRAPDHPSWKLSATHRQSMTTLAASLQSLDLP